MSHPAALSGSLLTEEVTSGLKGQGSQLFSSWPCDQAGDKNAASATVALQSVEKYEAYGML